jgi:hypothetical protein
MTQIYPVSSAVNLSVGGVAGVLAAKGADWTGVLEENRPF